MELPWRIPVPVLLHRRWCCWAQPSCQSPAFKFLFYSLSLLWNGTREPGGAGCVNIGGTGGRWQSSHHSPRPQLCGKLLFNELSFLVELGWPHWLQELCLPDQGRQRGRGMKKSHSCFLTAFQLHWQKGNFSFWDRGDLNCKDLWFIKKGNVTYEAGFPHRPEVRKRGQPWWLPSVFPPEIYVTGWARDLPGENGSAQAPRVDAVGWSSVILGFPGSPLLWDPICMCCIYCLQLSFKKGRERDSLKERFVTSTVSIFSPVMYKIQMIEMERYVWRNESKLPFISRAG